MQSAEYYRRQAQRARRLGGQVSTPDVADILLKMAEDYEDIAADLERGAIDIVHPERLPQRQHSRPRSN